MLHFTQQPTRFLYTVPTHLMTKNANTRTLFLKGGEGQCIVCMIEANIIHYYITKEKTQLTRGVNVLCMIEANIIHYHITKEKTKPTRGNERKKLRWFKVNKKGTDTNRPLELCGKY